jgi:hypothetical protein
MQRTGVVAASVKPLLTLEQNGLITRLFQQSN